MISSSRQINFSLGRLVPVYRMLEKHLHSLITLCQMSEVSKSNEGHVKHLLSSVQLRLQQHTDNYPKRHSRCPVGDKMFLNGFLKSAISEWISAYDGLSGNEPENDPC